MITREEAVTMLEEHIASENMRRHCYASEAVLRALARRLGHNEEEWGIAGLLHDIDVEITKADPLIHGPYAARLLDGKVTPEALDAIVMHNEMATGMERTTAFQHALAAGETITGLITATALVYPDKKVSSVKVKSITKRMKEKGLCRFGETGEHPGMRENRPFAGGVCRIGPGGDDKPGILSLES